MLTKLLNLYGPFLDSVGAPDFTAQLWFSSPMLEIGSYSGLYTATMATGCPANYGWSYFS